jgi:hypothetical protein
MRVMLIDSNMPSSEAVEAISHPSIQKFSTPKACTLSCYKLLMPESDDECMYL